MQYYNQNPNPYQNRPNQTDPTSPTGGAPHYEAHYQNPHSLRYDPPRNEPPQKKPSRAPKVIGGVAIVLACALAGFGGSMAAYAHFGGGDGTVVYRSVDSGDTAAAVSTGDELSLSDIAAASGQSVVSITTENVVSDLFSGGRIVSGAGSGVIISADGTIVTNNHVVSGAQNVTVTLNDGTEYAATVVGSDAASDVAVLKVEADGLVPAVLGDSDSLKVGEFCIAIGNPMGTLGGTVTDGIVSATDREMTIEGTSMKLLQMSAPVSPGNSGGGLFNADGELIGIVNAKTDGNGAEGLGFAIPINTAMDVAEEILVNGYVTGRPSLGLSAVSIQSAEEAAYAGVDEPGLYVAELASGGAAEAAGLQAGDRIVRLGDTDISTLADLSGALDGYAPGDEVTLTISRGGQQTDVQITLQERTQ